MKLMEIAKNWRSSPLDKYKPELVKIAQSVYDQWDEDEDEYAGGGICHLIADEFVDFFSDKGYEATSFNTSVGENHVMTAVSVGDDKQVYVVDIPPNVYETGGGYQWEKIPNVRFSVNDIIIDYSCSGEECFQNFFEEHY